MTAKSNKSEHSDGKPTLTSRQAKFLPILLASPTYAAACKKGKLDRTTLYQWLKDPAFKTEVERQRSEVTQEAFALLSHSLTEAVETLTVLLGDSDKRLRRFAAKDVIEFFLRHRELAELEKRIGAVEERLENQGRK